MPFSPSAHRPEGPASLDAGVRRRLGARLRAGYAGIEGEPLPDDQVDLLLRLRQKERERQPRRS